MLAIFKKKKQIIPSAPPEKMLINSCAKCSMEKFVDCIVNGNTHVVDDWDAIFNEYLTISGDTHISTILQLMKSISMLENKLILIQICVDQLSTHHHGYVADQLKKMGFRFEYENGPKLQRELEVTVTQSKSLLLQLNQDKQELEDIRANEGSAATIHDYELQYSALEEFKGVAIDPAKYMVSRYVADVKRMKERYKPQVL